MPFPGASPKEVEEQICVRVEEAIHDLDGIKEIRSTALDGLGQVVVEALPGYPTQRLTNEIKTRIDAITTFPPMLSVLWSLNWCIAICSVLSSWRAI